MRRRPAAPLRPATKVDLCLDLHVDVHGEQLPADHREQLARAVRERLSALEGLDEAGNGPHPLRTVSTGGAEGWSEGALMLPRRARLLLRLGRAQAQAAAATLDGSTLDLGHDCALRLDRPQLRELDPSPTLQARLVVMPSAGPQDAAEAELHFEEQVRAELIRLDPALDDLPLICGKATHLTLASGEIRGFALVLHDLTPAQSLLLQETGLGQHRWLGLGLLTPHKTITGLY
jgi:CRISPR-associated protein Cas6